MKQNKNTLLADLLKEITPEQQSKTTERMRLAAKIYDAMEAKGWSQKDFAAAVKQNESTISRWLSGAHNFTTDTLLEIQEVLHIEVLTENEKAKALGWDKALDTVLNMLEEDRLTYHSTGDFEAQHILKKFQDKIEKLNSILEKYEDYIP